MNNWNRRPSERYDREEYYRNSKPDHYTTENEEGRWHFAGKFEDHNDPTYSYATRERDLMREYPTYPLNEKEFYERHPYRRAERTRSPSNYDQGYSRSFYGDESYTYADTFDQEREPSFVGRGPRGWKRSDESIKETVCHALEQHPQIDASEVEVDVKDGIVTLRGNIHDRPAKRLATDVVDGLPGVSDVHNNLSIDRSFFERAKDLLTGEKH